MLEGIRAFWPRRRREFEARLIVAEPEGRRVVLTVGSRSLALRWPDVRAGEQVEILVDGMFIDNQPFLTAPPDEITFAEIQRWGPNSPPPIRWRYQPDRAPGVAPDRVVAVVTRDLDYRFLFPDEQTAREVDQAITQAIRAAGYNLT